MGSVRGEISMKNNKLSRDFILYVVLAIFLVSAPGCTKKEASTDIDTQAKKHAVAETPKAAPPPETKKINTVTPSGIAGSTGPQTERARVRFFQQYDADDYHSGENKVLLLESKGNGWKIVRERHDINFHQGKKDGALPWQATTGGATDPAIRQKQQEVLNAVESWRSAWSSKDQERYFQAYAADFTPEREVANVPAASGDVLTFKQSSNLRAGPGRQFDVVAWGRRNDTATELERKGDWIQVRITRNGRTGWAFGHLLNSAGAERPATEHYYSLTEWKGHKKRLFAARKGIQVKLARIDVEILKAKPSVKTVGELEAERKARAVKAAMEKDARVEKKKKAEAIKEGLTFPSYRIHPGDILDILFQIRTWTLRKDFRLAIDHQVSVKFANAPELDTIQNIRPDGTISLAYIGKIKVLGKTTDELKADLIKRYRNILVNPEIYIVVPQFRSRIMEIKKDLHTAPRGLSRLTMVRPDGYATFPMVGDVFVAGRTFQEMTGVLNRQYDNFLPGLHVDLFLQKKTGQVVYVLGQVRAPGPYTFNKPISVLESITLAGSYIHGAKIESIMVLRKKGDGKMEATRVNLEKSISLEDKLFILRPDDIVYVPKTWIKSAGEAMRDIADIFLFNGVDFSFNYSVNGRSSSKNNPRQVP